MPRRQNEEYQYAVRRILQELFNLKVNDPGQNEFVKKRLKTLHAFPSLKRVLLSG